MKIRVLIDDKEVFVSSLGKEIKEEYYMKGKHSAVNVAWYLVSHINNAGGTITNLKLQKRRKKRNIRRKLSIYCSWNNYYRCFDYFNYKCFCI